MIPLFVYTLLFKSPGIEAEAITVLKKTSIIGVFGVGVILFGIIVFANQISRQLMRMKELASIISQGDIRSRLPVEERAGLGMVIDSLNMICVKVGSMIEDINSYTKDHVSQLKHILKNILDFRK